MRGAPGTQVTLTLKRSGINTPVHVTLTREVIKIQDVKDRLFSSPAGNIGYIRLDSFDENADPHIRTAVVRWKPKRMAISTASSSTCATTPAGCSTRRSRSATIS